MKPPGNHGEGGHEHAHEAEGFKEIPMVPDRASDYRGFIGVIQREVQPWLPATQEFAHASATN